MRKKKCPGCGQGSQGQGRVGPASPTEGLNSIPASPIEASATEILANELRQFIWETSRSAQAHLNLVELYAEAGDDARLAANLRMAASFLLAVVQTAVSLETGDEADETDDSPPSAKEVA